MTTTVVLVSPGKANKQITINSPTIRALNSFQSKALPPDHSWDDELYVEMRGGVNGETICERERPEERHAKLKTKLKAQDAQFTALELALGEIKKERESDAKKLADLLERLADGEKRHEEIKKERESDAKKLADLLERLAHGEKRHEESEKRQDKQSAALIQQLEGFIKNLEATISTMVLVEEYEVIDGTLRAYNDRIYDVNRGDGLKHEEKQILKKNGLRYILDLLSYEPEFPFGDPNTTPVEQAFRTAEALLNVDEWRLCYCLRAHRETLGDPRNMAQHPRPDRSTAARWLTRIAPDYQATFTNLLNSNPLRMKTSEDGDSSDLRIVVDDGEYEGPEVQQKLLAQLRDTLEDLQQEQAALIGNKRRRVE